MSGYTRLYLIIAAATLGCIAWIGLNRKTLCFNWLAVIVSALICMAAGVTFVRVFAFMEGGFTDTKLDKMSLFGGVFMMPLVLALGAKLTKRDMRDVFDIYGICMPWTMTCMRVNCLFAGCCLGNFIHGTDFRWPTREAEIVFYVAFIALLAPKVYKRETRGTVYPLYMLCYGIFRFIIEFLRQSDSTGVLHIAHAWALLAAVIGLGVYWEVQNRNKKKKR